jgi:hypothetical protein
MTLPGFRDAEFETMDEWEEVARGSAGEVYANSGGSRAGRLASSVVQSPWFVKLFEAGVPVAADIGRDIWKNQNLDSRIKEYQEVDMNQQKYALAMQKEQVRLAELKAQLAKPTRPPEAPRPYTPSGGDFIEDNKQLLLKVLGVIIAIVVVMKLLNGLGGGGDGGGSVGPGPAYRYRRQYY